MNPDRDQPPARPAPDPALEKQIHGSLVEVRGLGVLIVGRSGVGKSECVVELVRRGHRLVADDVVRLRISEDGKRLVGWAPEHIRHYIEVRGLGLLSVSDLFGAEAVLDECTVDFVIRLETFEPGIAFERIGLDRELEMLLGIGVPKVRLPVHAGSNPATIVDLAIRDWQLRLRGINAARRLDERLRAHGLATLEGAKKEGA